MLGRSIDFIDINDDSINNIIKIEALKSKEIIIHDELLEKSLDYYDKLFKENEEFWYFLDKAILGENKERLKKLLYALDITIKDIDKSIKLVKKFGDSDPDLKNEFSNSLKYKYLSLFIIYEDFISMLLKEFNLYEIAMSIDSAIKKLHTNKIITEKQVNYLNEARLIRNKIGHRYKQPNIEVIIDFIESNEVIQKELYDYIKGFLN